MKAIFAIATATALTAAGNVFAQYPSSPVRSSTAPTAEVVTYGPTPRPAKQTAPTRKPQHVATAPARPGMQQGTPAQRVATRTNTAPVRTAMNQGVMPGAQMVPAPTPDPGYSSGSMGGATNMGTVDGGTMAGGDCGSGGCNSGCGAGGGYPYGPNNRTPLVRGWYVPFWHSIGGMPQHYPYFPNAHGYYYFHPYNAIHVAQQQEMVNRWGLDPRNPMDNRFFEKIYQEQEAAQIQDTPLPLMPR